MALDPLSLIILLFFLAVVALALTLWFLLTLRQPTLEPKPARAKVARPAQKAADLDLETSDFNTSNLNATDLNNDDFRGAKAQAKALESTPEPPTSERPAPERPPKRDDAKREDAFERFIKSKNDELEF